MANRTVYVDGTTSGSPGGGAHYATLNAALNGEFTVDSGALNTTGGILTIECSFISGGDTTAISWPAFTGADANNYIKIISTVFPNGKPNTSTAYYRSAAALSVGTNYTQIWGIQVSCSATAFTAANRTNVLFDGCLAKSADGAGFACSDAAGGTIWRNCIAYECGTHGFWAVPDSGTVTIQNCTAKGNGTATGTYYGFYRQGGTVTITNCLAQDNSDGDYNGTMTMTYCVSKDATASGTGCVANYTDNPFADVVNDDYKISSPNTTLIGQGANLYSSFTGDTSAASGTRPNGAFTIGAHEPAAASVPIKKFMHAYRAHRS